jgi:hypothetical protein
MIKIIIQEERPEKPVDEEMVERYTGKTHFVTTNEAYSEDKVIIAALLRGIADRFDPR